MELNLPLLVLYPTYETQISNFPALIDFWMDTA